MYTGNEQLSKYLRGGKSQVFTTGVGDYPYAREGVSES